MSTSKFAKGMTVKLTPAGVKAEIGPKRLDKTGRLVLTGEVVANPMFPDSVKVRWTGRKAMLMVPSHYIIPVEA